MTETTYRHALSETEPVNDSHPSYPLEVRVETREVRDRRVGFSKRDRTSHRFYVVNHDEEAVIHDGRWTTPDTEHVTYDAAKARAYGIKSGYLKASDLEQRPSG